MSRSKCRGMLFDETLQSVINEIEVMKTEENFQFDQDYCMQQLAFCHKIENCCNKLVKLMGKSCCDTDDSELLSAELKAHINDLSIWILDLSNDDEYSAIAFEQYLDSLESVMATFIKMIHLWENHQIRNIDDALKEFSKSLISACNVKVASDLLESLQFSHVKLGLAFGQVSATSQCLKDTQPKDQLYILEEQIELMVKSLGSCCVAYLHNPSDKGLKDFRASVLENIEELVQAVRTEVNEGSLDRVTVEPNYFRQTGLQIRNIIEKNSQNPHDVCEFLQELKVPVEKSIQQSLAVAQCSSKRDQTTISMATRKVLSELEIIKDSKHCKPLVDNLRLLSTAYSVLESAVDEALVHQVILYLTNPFDCLMKIVNGIHIGNIPGINTLLDQHKFQTDHIFYLAGFAETIVDRDRAYAIEKYLIGMDWLEKFLLASIVDAEKSGQSSPKLLAIVKIWIEWVVSLRALIDNSIEPHLFFNACKAEVGAIVADMTEENGGECLAKAVLYCKRAISFESNIQCLDFELQSKLYRADIELTNCASSNLEVCDDVAQKMLLRVQYFWTILTQICAHSQQQSPNSFINRPRDIAHCELRGLPPGVKFTSLHNLQLSDTGSNDTSIDITYFLNTTHSPARIRTPGRVFSSKLRTFEVKLDEIMSPPLSRNITDDVSLVKEEDSQQSNPTFLTISNVANEQKDLHHFNKSRSSSKEFLLPRIEEEPSGNESTQTTNHFSENLESKC